ncbi:MAG: restriction endonuclease [Muribaculaceae bacterium]|nr:restriction endonuclease [Muribaculaceae bacterium]
MKPILTTELMLVAAKKFCNEISGTYYEDLFGATDGKAVGTFVEHKFQKFLFDRYDIGIGSSANGLDLPSMNTDIKVTSIKQPQSSCPFKDSKQKIYGLGYNLIIFVYQKHDNPKTKKGMLDILDCVYVDKSRTSDYQMTTGLRSIIANNGNIEDIFAYLIDHNIPADEVSLMNMAEDIYANPPQIGYLTISNALQWRLQYRRVLSLQENVDGIISILKNGNC